MLPRISLEHILHPQVACSEAWETTVEKLAVSLCRDRVCVLTIPTPHSAAYSISHRNLAKELQSRTPSGMGIVSPGSKAVQYRLGGASNTLMDVTYGYLEATARAVLGALCRSRLLRLRSDTFAPCLDDLPLPRTQLGSSLLTLTTYVDNFQESCQGQAPIFPDPQEEMTDRGLLSVILPQEAQRTQKGQMLSVMQVKDASGNWKDVVLGANEVVVLLGHTMGHATAGILSPATYRVAGDPYATRKGNSRRVLHFELRPRPAAVLNFHKQLAEAGHHVAPKYSAPVGVRSLMQQFEALMSPGKDVHTPQNMEGVAAHTAWEQATCQKTGRKRSSDTADLAGAGAGNAAEAEAAPVTRSGNVRRTSDGHIVGQHRPSRFKQQVSAVAGAAGGAAAAAPAQGSQESALSAGEGSGDGGGAPAAAPSLQGGTSTGGASTASGSVAEAMRRRRASLEPASSKTLYCVRGHTCTVLDGCLQDAPGECITLCVRSFTGVERWFYLNSSLTCGRVFETYCDCMGINLGSVKFLYRGNRVFGADTPKALQVADEAEFVAVPESSDRLQQARELGPLYETLFATTGGGGSGDVPI